jgi:hypothetical protein
MQNKNCHCQKAHRADEVMSIVTREIASSALALA